MELLIDPEQFVIKYSPGWIAVLLISGLILFFISKFWREWLRKSHKHSFMPGVLFAASFIFLIGGINYYVYKIVFNKEGITLFNIRHFNQHIKWSEINQVNYHGQQELTMTTDDNTERQETIHINLSELSSDSMDKVKILIALKLKQSKLKPRKR